MGTVARERAQYHAREGGHCMSNTEDQTQEQTRNFVNLKEIRREPRLEQTEEEILAWMTYEIQADKRILDLLAEL